MAVRLKFRCRLVIDDLIRAENVVLVVHHHIAVQGDHVAYMRLAVGVKAERARRWAELARLGNGNHLLAGSSGSCAAGPSVGSANDHGGLFGGAGNALVNACPESAA